MSRIGFIGVGELARYTIRGWRRGGYEKRINLSPRNAQNAAELARDHACDVMPDNQSVVDSSDLVFLATRPEDCFDALAGLDFRPDQVLVSAVAGVASDRLRDSLTNSALKIVRVMPVSSAQAGYSPTLVYPRHQPVCDLFDRCGRAIAVEQERQFDQGTILACVYSWYFALFDRLVEATGGDDLPAELAAELVVGMARGAADLALSRPTDRPGDIADEIATPGTYSRLGLDLLRDEAAFDAWQRACDLLRSRLATD
ncbi:MAG: NAD(P)-binding domain-containing protein [Gammaproteobacteria bacterium]|nr:NAD(P)-binding domain-containing protein [Gammaproteobacteria bacterium]